VGDDVLRETGKNELAGKVAALTGLIGLEVAKQNAVGLRAVISVGLLHVPDMAKQNRAGGRRSARLYWHDGTMLRYRVSKLDCDVCPLKMQCCPNMIARQVPRDVHEDARELARRLMGTKRFVKSRDERKRVEMRFAHLKTHHGFEHMRLRGLSGARDEFHLAAIVQNLKTLALRVLRPPHLPGVA